MATAHQLMTADTLLRMPRDGFRYELIEGELRRMAPAGYEHGRIVLNISAPLHLYVRTHRLGAVFAAETGFVLGRDPDTVRAPDVAFVRRERIELVGSGTGFWPGAPDLAVEVVSPGDLYTEVDEKVAMWLEHGAQMVVVINPRRHLVTVYRAAGGVIQLRDDETLDGGDVVPGWAMPVHEIFAEV